MTIEDDHYPTIKAIFSRTLDLRVVEQQLDTIEAALMTAYRRLSPIDARQTAEAIDTLLTLKQSFGFVSPVNPVQERQSAVIEQKTYEDE